MAFIYKDIAFHYSGCFVGEGLSLRYEGLEEDVRLEVDEICYWELFDLCKQFG